MKKIIASIVVSLSTVAAQASTTSVLSLGQEELNSTAKANLATVGISKRLESGVEFFANAHRITPVAEKSSSEYRPELGLGYAAPTPAGLVYAQAFVGQRVLPNRANADYHGVRVGLRTPIAAGWFTDVSYRYRDAHSIAWENHTYVAGVGYGITKSTAVVVGVAKTTGDYQSQGVQLLLVTRH
jgi:hypothetical protein